MEKMALLSLVFLSSHTWLGLGLSFNEVKSIFQDVDVSRMFLCKVFWSQVDDAPSHYLVY